jgi:H/ACA ribonucleoprotein complex subunit 4
MEINLKKIKQNKTTKELLEFSIINIDKPSGPTSFNVSNFVKKFLKLRKTSHFGTLDPKVTGVLPIALNRACKLSGYFIGENKTYVGIARFHKPVELKKIQQTINKKFLGKIKQTPPLKSRVKREEREREIYSFKILEQSSENPNDFLFISEVQGGTYIRKLIDDLGKELKLSAHMLELRRIKAGIFTENHPDYPIINLYDLEKAVQEYENKNETLLRKILIPAEIVTEIHQPFEIKKENLKQIYTGKPIKYSDLKEKPKKDLEKGKIISIFCNEVLVGMYRITNEKENFARPEFVMQPIPNN